MTDTPPEEAERRARPAADPIDTRAVRKLADILRDTDLTSIEVERGDLRIRVAREVTVAAAPLVAAPTLPAPAPPAAPATAAPSPEVPARKAGELVKSPMVGTVFLQPQPGAPPFVRVGDKVDAGQSLCIIEAMKTMNPIPAPRAGTLVELLVGDGQPVEFGQPLAVIA